MDSVAVNLLIDLIRSPESEAIDSLDERQLQCVVDLLFAAMWSDGDASDIEYEEIAALLAATPWFERVSPATMERMFDRATAAAGALAGTESLGTGTHAWLRARASLLVSAKLREVVYRMVASVTLADKVVTDPERDFLLLLASALDIPRERPLRVLGA